jgi:nucleotide-binding universal stress UspA family protein
MPAPVIVPLDRSAFAEDALPLAVQIAGRLGVPVHLVLVHTPPPMLATFDQVIIAPPELDREFREEERAYLARVVQRLAVDGVSAIPVILDGLVAGTLVEYISTHPSAIVVMTTHGRGGMSRFFLGSIADRLTREVHCPVLLVRPGGTEHRPAQGDLRVLIPLDGSQVAESTIDQVVDVFGRNHTVLYCLQVVVLPPVILPMAGAIAAPSATMGRMVLAANEYLDGLALRLRNEGLQVHTDVRSGELIAPEIFAYAVEKDPDLIALATRGHGGIERALFGSVADKLVRGASVPVLVWNPPLGAASRMLDRGVEESEVDHREISEVGAP